MPRDLSSSPADRFREISGQLLGEGLAVRFRAAGTSMEPAIGDGDLITVAPANTGDIKPGDVVFYASSGRTIAHRVVEIRNAGTSAATFIVRGDARSECDEPVVASQILGRVVAVERARPPRLWKRLLVFIARRGRRAQPVRSTAQDPPRV